MRPGEVRCRAATNVPLWLQARGRLQISRAAPTGGERLDNQDRGACNNQDVAVALHHSSL
jgi:hypothetical protein